MYWLVVALLFLPLVVTAGSDVPYCFFDGCAHASVCRCVSFFSECDISDNVQGTCKLTPWGIGAIVTLSVTAVAVVVIFLCALYFCKKILCCCCKSRERPMPMHTTVYYQPAQPHGSDAHEML